MIDEVTLAELVESCRSGTAWERRRIEAALQKAYRQGWEEASIECSYETEHRALNG